MVKGSTASVKRRGRRRKSTVDISSVDMEASKPQFEQRITGTTPKSTKKGSSRSPKGLSKAISTSNTTRRKRSRTPVKRKTEPKPIENEAKILLDKAEKGKGLSKRTVIMELGWFQKFGFVVLYFLLSLFTLNIALLSMRLGFKNPVLLLFLLAFESLVSSFAYCFKSERLFWFCNIMINLTDFVAPPICALAFLSRVAHELSVLDSKYLPFHLAINAYLSSCLTNIEVQRGLVGVIQLTSALLILYCEWLADIETRFLGTVGIVLILLARFGNSLHLKLPGMYRMLFVLSLVDAISPFNFSLEEVSFLDFFLSGLKAVL